MNDDIKWYWWGAKCHAKVDGHEFEFSSGILHLIHSVKVDGVLIKKWFSLWPNKPIQFQLGEKLFKAQIRLLNFINWRLEFRVFDGTFLKYEENSSFLSSRIGWLSMGVVVTVSFLIGFYLGSKGVL